MNKDCFRDKWVGICPYCEKEFISRLSALFTKIKSCGCLHQKQSSENCKRINSKRRVERGNNPEEPLSPKIRLIRDALFKQVGKMVLVMDNFTCQFCKKRGGYLNVHHIEPIHSIDVNNRESLKKFYNLENLITLCRECHEEEAHVGASIYINIENQILFKEKTQIRKISKELIEEYQTAVKNKIQPWVNNFFSKGN